MKLKDLSVKEDIRKKMINSILVILFALSTSLMGATIYVNSSSGDDTNGDGSSGSPYKTFHKGYTEASSDDIIDLTGTFTWTDAAESGDVAGSGYSIAKNLTIQGQGANVTIVQANAAENTADRRIFTVPVANTVTFSNITVRYGKVGSNADGGGIQVSGTSTIDKCDISYNRAPDGGGGGVDVTGSLTVQNSAIHNNVAHYMGGGLNRNYSSGSGGAPGASDLLHVINSTISNNQVTSTSAYFEGGGVFFRRGSGTITNSTISYNTIVYDGVGTSGVGTGDAGSTVSLKNNIITNNTLTNCWSGEIGHRQAGGGTYIDNGGNIFGKLGYYIDGMTVSTTSWVDQDDGCTSPDGTFLLQDGGATTGTINQNSTLALNNSLYGTMSHAITADSGIEIDNGLTGTNGVISVPTADQRGADRNGDTDIGAYEYAGVFGPPVVEGLFPADDATAVTTTANLVITFDETVDVESGDIVIYDASDGSIFETIDVTSGLVTGTGTATITINPSSDFAHEAAYYINIDATAFDDASSNSYAGISDATTWNFTADDATATPVIVGFVSSAEVKFQVVSSAIPA